MSNKFPDHRPITRKSFLQTSSLAVLAAGLPSLGSAFAGTKPSHAPSDVTRAVETIRSISYNVFNGCIGYKGINGRELPPGEVSHLVKTARDRKQIPRRIMLELELYQPNIINFSEGPNEQVVAEMAKMQALKYAFFAGGKDGKGGFPGAVLTNYEIIAQETRPFANKKNDVKELFTRHWGKAKLRTPSGKILMVHSAHLWPFKKEPRDTEIRMEEIKELVAAIRHDLENGIESVLLQGDLNHSPDMPEYQKLKDAGLIDTFVAAGVGDGNTIDSINPSRRIDFIFAQGQIAKEITRATSLFEGNFRLNVDDPKGYALSDHLPVLADFAL
jgi:endonuclease/exonuclease/phosphatase family metal-dependent hydrolase